MKAASSFDFQTEAPREREMREWWAVVDDGVRRVTGYSCAPQNPDMWWCPGYGYSMTEGHHLFTTEADALDRLIAEMERRLTETQEIIIALRVRRKTAGGIYA